MDEIKNFSDEQLADYVRHQDKEAYFEIVQRYQNKLLRYVSTITNDEAKAADIVQNVFLKAYINLNSFNDKKKFSTWIYRITHNETINELVKYKNETPLLENMDFRGGDDLETDFSKKEIKEKVKKCLISLPFKYSEPISLFFLEEKSYEEISDIMRLPVNTVGTRINRGKKLMKKICQTMK